MNPPCLIDGGAGDPTVLPCRSLTAVPLVERDQEVQVLTRAVRRLQDGVGCAVSVQGVAGSGKSALVAQVVAEALDAGCQVRYAAAAPLERGFGYGVLRTLLETAVRDLDTAARAALLRGATEPAGAMLLGLSEPGPDVTTAIAHSVFWLSRTLTITGPLALVVDDAQWADRESLEVLAYLAARATDVPLLLVLAGRADAADTAADVISLYEEHRTTTVLRPRPLTPAGAVRLMRRLAPDLPVATARQLHAEAGGNPWLLDALVREVGGQDDPGREVRRLEAPRARDALRRRLAALDPAHRAVAAAIAVAGADAPPAVLIAIADTSADVLARGRDALVAAGFLAESGRAFVHSVLRQAIIDDLARSTADRLHLAAARALERAGASFADIAAHLLCCPPQGDPQISELLGRAAVDAWRAGDPERAATYLLRVVEERAPGDNRSDLLAQLTVVAYDTGRADAGDHLRRAVAASDREEDGLRTLLAVAGLTVVDSPGGDLADALRRERAGETDPARRLTIETALLDTLLMQPGCHRERHTLATEIVLGDDVDPLQRHLVLAHRAWLGAELGSPDAAACGALALEALDGGLLLAHARRRPGYHLCVGALIVSDHLEQAEHAIADLERVAEDHGSARLRAAAAWYAGEVAARLGDARAAEAQARVVLDLVPDTAELFRGGAVTLLVNALADRGATEEARAVLAERRMNGTIGALPWEVGVLHARARLALAEGDFQTAYGEACQAGALRERQGRPNPTWTPWRTTASLALSHMGRVEEAASLADVELRTALAFGAPLPILAAYHARIVAEPDAQRRLQLAERAFGSPGVPDTGHAPLLLARIRLEVGATLSRLGDRVEARDPLQSALADADRVGALPLADRARRELVASGLRPRRAQTAGADALTPRQREVAELAAAGTSNRAIAHQLFLSVKTVETHLAAAYRKLGVDTRDGLAAELVQQAA